MEMKPDDSRKFNISIPLNDATITNNSTGRKPKCAYLSHSNNSVNGSNSNTNSSSVETITLKSTGCETLGV